MACGVFGYWGEWVLTRAGQQFVCPWMWVLTRACASRADRTWPPPPYAVWCMHLPLCLWMHTPHTPTHSAVPNIRSPRFRASEPVTNRNGLCHCHCVLACACHVRSPCCPPVRGIVRERSYAAYSFSVFVFVSGMLVSLVPALRRGGLLSVLLRCR